MDIIKKFDAPESTDPDANPTPNHDNSDETTRKAPEHSESKRHDHDSLKDKIKDALQEWSNDNERDIQEDDSTPLRSGL